MLLLLLLFLLLFLLFLLLSLLLLLQLLHLLRLIFTVFVSFYFDFFLLLPVATADVVDYILCRFSRCSFTGFSSSFDCTETSISLNYLPIFTTVFF